MDKNEVLDHLREALPLGGPGERPYRQWVFVRVDAIRAAVASLEAGPVDYLAVEQMLLRVKDNYVAQDQFAINEALDGLHALRMTVGNDAKVVGAMIDMLRRRPALRVVLHRMLADDFAKQAKPVGSDACSSWVGCGECDIIFPCHNGKAPCLRLNEPPKEEPAAEVACACTGACKATGVCPYNGRVVYTPTDSVSVNHTTGEVVVTRAGSHDGPIIAVTRQDAEGRILSVIAEATPPKDMKKAVMAVLDKHIAVRWDLRDVNVLEHVREAIEAVFEG